MSKIKNPTAYATIFNNLRNRIFSGKLKPGDLLPSENQLCTDFSVSRETVRKGLKELETEGLIYSKPKVGYFVSLPNHDRMNLAFTDAFLNSTARYQDIHGQVPDETLQQILEIPANQKVIVFSLVYYDENKKPTAYDVKYIPYERAYPSVESEIRYAVFPDFALSKANTYDYYIEMNVSATVATENLSQILSCPVGTPLLLIERIFIQQNGKRIGYGKQYLCQPHGKLIGISGAIQNQDKETI